MLEVLFNDSAAGSMQMAIGHGSVIGGCISVIGTREDGSPLDEEETERLQREAEERERRRWAGAVPLPGGTGDILPFPLWLSIGPIGEESIGPLREATLEQLFSIYPDDTKESAARQLFDRAVQNLDTARRRLSAGEPARIWYSNRPDELCGMLWFMDQLRRMNLQNTDIQLICQRLQLLCRRGGVRQRRSRASGCPRRSVKGSSNGGKQTAV